MAQFPNLSLLISEPDEDLVGIGPDPGCLSEDGRMFATDTRSRVREAMVGRPTEDAASNVLWMLRSLRKGQYRCHTSVGAIEDGLPFGPRLLREGMTNSTA